jgi:hypothetical protein
MINMQQWELSGSGQLARPGFGSVHVDAAEPGSSCFTGIWEAVQAAFSCGMMMCLLIPVHCLVMVLN